MSLAIITLTPRGTELGRRLKAGLDPDAAFYAPARLAGDSRGEAPYDDLRALVGQAFGRHSGLVMVMALGIVVRLIAPHIRNKTGDPAVVAVDETGRYSISVLSGHWGGANSLARRVASCCGAQAVITTASDLMGLPSFDELAREIGAVVEPPDGLKKVAMAMLSGSRVALYADPGIDIPLPVPTYPTGSYAKAGGEPAVLVTNRIIGADPQAACAFLRPRNLVVGVGCRKGVPAESIIRAIGETLALGSLSPLSIKCITSVDFKGGEAGLVGAASALGVPLELYSREEVKSVEGRFQGSEAVRKATGLGGVCEPCAVLGAKGGRLLLRKNVRGPVAVAVAEARCGL